LGDRAAPDLLSPASRPGTASRDLVAALLHRGRGRLEVVRRNRAVGIALLSLGAVWVGGGFLHVAGNQHIQRSASAPGMERLGLLMCALGVGSLIGTWWINHRGKNAPRAVLLGGGLVLA